MIKDNLNNSDNLLPARCLPDLWRFILVMAVDLLDDVVPLQILYSA